MATKFITKKGYEKLKQELENLKMVERRNISSRIQSAKELGDLSENAEYAEAKNDQNANETKIVELEQTIRDLKVVQNSGDTSKVSVGSTIKAKTPNGEISFTIVGSEESNPKEGFISNESPIGKALLGHRIGDKIKVEVPSGTIIYQVLSIE